MVWDGCVEFCLLCFLLTIVGPWRASKPESWQSENYTLLVKNGHLVWSDPDNWHYGYRITLTLLMTEQEIVLLDIGSHDEPVHGRKGGGKWTTSKWTCCASSDPFV